MLLQKAYHCDVFVVGSGIAGISAALTAAESGADVILACKGNLFSGCSFYPGTWGLGLIGPADPADEADLARTIQDVGCGMADPEMVKAFVSGIQPAIARVRNMGVKLRRPANAGETAFIPCFDHKHRDWNGIEFDSAREIFSQKLKEHHIRVLPQCEVLELVKDRNRVCGAVMAWEGKLRYVGCGAVVLATGGYGSIFKYHLCTEDVLGIGQHLALEAGCRLVNMEFMQMIPGYIAPAYKTVFNEKTFRYARLKKADGSPLLNPGEAAQLELRSTHGPFTCRLPSKAIDLALFDVFRRDEAGIGVSYSEAVWTDPPEFVKVYFDWLLQAKGLSPKDPIQIGAFAHAANGGIRIRPDASTGVAGLFAAGEVTGGMHGADRIGGLSTANGLVFGTIAGRSASAYAAEADGCPGEYEFAALAAEDLDGKRKALQQLMFENAMIARCEAGLSSALEAVRQLRGEVTQSRKPSTDPSAVTRTHRLLARLNTAESVLQAALLRKESRGSHYRTDFPQQDDTLEKQIIIHLDADGIHAEFTKGA